MSASRTLLKIESLLLVFYAVLSFSILMIVLPFISLLMFCKPAVIESIFKYNNLRTELLTALKNSLLAAFISTLILTIIGIPLGYVLARVDFRGKSLIEALIDLPLVVPHPIVGVMLLVMLGSRGLIPIGIEDTFWGIVAAMMFVSFPLLVDTVKLGFVMTDPMLEYVARSLGVSFTRTFFTISLPLCFRNIIAGALLAFARALSEVGSLLILATYPETVTVLIIKWFDIFGLYYAVAVSALYLGIVFALFLILRILLRGIYHA